MDHPVDSESNPETPLEADQDAVNEPSPSVPTDNANDTNRVEPSAERESVPTESPAVSPPETPAEEVTSGGTPAELPEPNLAPESAPVAAPDPASEPAAPVRDPGAAAIRSAPPRPARSGRTTADLEQRVRRLEEALSLMQQGRPVAIPTPIPTPFPQGVPLATPNTPATPAVPTARIVADPPMASPLPPGPPPSRQMPPVGNRGPGWLFWEMWIELRVFWRMYTDPRYQMTWFGRFVPLALLLVFLFSAYVLPLASVPVLGPWFESLEQLIVAYLLVKCLSHEARRYRQTAPDLPASLRW